MPSFHSIEEQQVYSRAEDAYDEYLRIRDECREEWAQQDEDEDES